MRTVIWEYDPTDKSYLTCIDRVLLTFSPSPYTGESFGGVILLGKFGVFPKLTHEFKLAVSEYELENLPRFCQTSTDLYKHIVENYYRENIRTNIIKNLIASPIFELRYGE